MENKCRLCGETPTTLVPIFSFDRDRLISDMIIFICPIKITIDEPQMPSKICGECLRTIRSAHDLREKSVRNDCKFRNAEMSSLQAVIIKAEQDDWPLKPTEEGADESTMDDTYFDGDPSSVNDNDDDPNFSPLNPAEASDKPKKYKGLMCENGLFKCPECSKTFQYESNLGIHYRELHPSKVLPRFKHRIKSTTCEYCGLFISQSKNYRRHLVQYHDSSLPFGCSLCTYRFSLLKRLKSHGIKSHSEANVDVLRRANEGDNHINAVVECDMCGKKYIDLKSLALHMKKNHEKTTRPYSNLPNKFPCPHCERILTTRSNLLRHFSHSHPDKFPHPCTHCSEGFRTQRLLFNHLEKVHGIEQSQFATVERRIPVTSEPLICHFCSEDCSTSKHNLERHLIMAHEEQLENVQQCSTCHKKFVYEDSWKQHLLWHQRKASEKSFAFSCVQCNKRFPNEEKLERHSITHAQTSLICHICGKTLKNRFSYENHIKRHAPVREHQCPRCPASFVYIKQLERHMVGHSEERKFICNQPGCTKAFKDSYTFNLHQKRHNGELQRKCTCMYVNCGKKFFSKYALDRHILTHTLQKPHQCEYCDTSYAQKNDLVKHLKIHIGDDIYKCTFEGCLEAFRLQTDLKRHYAVHYLNN